MGRARPFSDPEGLLRELGVKHRRIGGELVARCPSPAHPHAPDARALGSWSMRAAGERAGVHHCFSCGFSGGPRALVAAVLGLDARAARAWLAERFGEETSRVELAAWAGKVPPRPDLLYPEGTRALWSPDLPPSLAPALAYVERRGFDRAEVERLRIGVVPPGDAPYAGRVVVPVVVGGRMVDLVARDYLGRSDAPKVLSGRRDLGARRELALWGADDLAGPSAVVVEGVWGAQAVRRALGARVAVAACGSAWSEERTEILRARGIRDVVVVGDGDPAGRRWAGQVERELSALEIGVRVVDLPDGEQPDGSYLLGRIGEIRFI